jgi:uncharacterized protein (DUF58 family)
MVPAFVVRLERRLHVSREGLVWLLLSAGMLATGLLKGINLITLLGCILLAVALCNFYLARRQIEDVTAARELPDFVVAGAAGRWRIRLAVDDGRTHVGLTVHDPGLGEPLDWFVDALPPEGSTVDQALLPRERGVFDLPPLIVSSGYPLGLAALRRSFGAGDQVHVAPRLGTIHRGLLRHWLARRCPTIGVVRVFPMRHPTGQTEFHGLRAYRPGDNPRWIHWRSSARRGALMIREFEEYPNDDLVLLVDPSADAIYHGAPFERLCSLAASICWEWCRQKGDHLTLLIAGPTPVCLEGPTGPTLLASALRALARLQPAPRDDGAATLAVLRERPQPPTAHLLLSVGPSELPGSLAELLQQPVAAIDVARGEETSFADLDLAVDA